MSKEQGFEQYMGFLDKNPLALNGFSAALLFWAEHLVRTKSPGIEHLRAAVKHVENGSGGLIVTANHISLLDAKVMGSVRRQIKNKDIPFAVFLGNKYVGYNDDGTRSDTLNDRVIGKVAAFASEHAGVTLTAVPQSVTPNREVMKLADEVISGVRDNVLGNKGVVGIFPEGHRSKDGVMHTAMGGAINRLFRGNESVQQNTLILPIAIEGTNKVVAQDPMKFHPFEQATVTYGEPYTYSDATEQAAFLGVSLADVMAIRICELLPMSMWGDYREVLSEHLC